MLYFVVLSSLLLVLATLLQYAYIQEIKHSNCKAHVFSEDIFFSNQTSKADMTLMGICTTIDDFIEIKTAILKLKNIFLVVCYYRPTLFNQPN